MPCNTCAKPFSLLRKEKGCPGCGFSYCSKCLDNKIFLRKLNAEAKVCAKCKRAAESKEAKTIEPPDAYYKRLSNDKGESSNTQAKGPSGTTSTDREILERLQNLKVDSEKPATSTQEIVDRLQKIKGARPTATVAEIQERLAKLRGVPVGMFQSKPVLPAPDLRTEQEQADDLIKQYLEHLNIDSNYKDEFDALVGDIESRLGNLQGSNDLNIKPQDQAESETEENIIRKLVDKAKAEAAMEDEFSPDTNDELPFCEICNEDASMRCLGCRYLFCKRCYMDHRDDDDGCNNYEPYTTPKTSH